MEEEQLIEYVRANLILYDFNNKLYRNQLRHMVMKFTMYITILGDTMHPHFSSSSSSSQSTIDAIILHTNKKYKILVRML